VDPVTDLDPDPEHWFTDRIYNLVYTRREGVPETLMSKARVPNLIAIFPSLAGGVFCTVMEA
jgi:hypothetical protein